MREVKYTNIESFLLRMGITNIRVKRQGRDYCDMLDHQLGWAIRQRMVGHKKYENNAR